MGRSQLGRKRRVLLLIAAVFGGCEGSAQHAAGLDASDTFEVSPRDLPSETGLGVSPMDAPPGAGQDAEGLSGVDGVQVSPRDLGLSELDLPMRQDASSGAETASLPGPDVQDGYPCGGLALALCNDGNECTKEQLDAHCTCTHTPVSDETACNDGDVCTEADHCIAGLCVGRRIDSSPALLGSVANLQDAPGIATLVAFASADRAVFATGDQLTLVGLDQDRLSILDRRLSAITVRTAQISPQIWVSRPRLFLVPLEKNRLAIIGDQQGIDLYDVSDKAFVPRGRYGFPVTRSVHGAAGLGARIWVCANTNVQLYTVDQAGELAEGQVFALPTNHACQGLALSADGNTLLAATWNGLDFVDVSKPDGSMALSGGVLAGHFLLDVSTNAAYTAVYELQDKVSGLGDVLVLPAAGDKPIATFPMAVEGATPIGFAMVDAGILIQTMGKGTSAPLTGTLYALAATGSTLLQSQALGTTSPNEASGVPVHTVGTGALAAFEPYHQVVRIDKSGAWVTITGPEQGAFERVRANGTNTVEVHGARSMALVDLSNPAAPTLKEGGMVLPADIQALQLELSSTEPSSPTILPLSGSLGNPLGSTVSLLWSSPNQLPVPAGSMVTDGSSGLWTAAGDYLVELVPEGASDFRIRRFRTSSTTSADGQRQVPELEQVVSTPKFGEGETRSATWFDMDAQSGRMAILEKRRKKLGDAAASDLACLIVFKLGSGGYQQVTVWRGEPGVPVGVAVEHDRTLLAMAEGVMILDDTGQITASTAADAAPAPVTDRLLGFDGRLAYVASGNRVRVLRGTDLYELHSYSAPQFVTSMTTVGNHLVFGMPNTVSIAAPACPSLGSE